MTQPDRYNLVARLDAAIGAALDRFEREQVLPGAGVAFRRGIRRDILAEVSDWLAAMAGLAWAQIVPGGPAYQPLPAEPGRPSGTGPERRQNRSQPVNEGDLTQPVAMPLRPGGVAGCPGCLAGSPLPHRVDLHQAADWECTRPLEVVQDLADTVAFVRVVNQRYAGPKVRCQACRRMIFPALAEAMHPDGAPDAVDWVCRNTTECQAEVRRNQLNGGDQA